MKTMKTLVVALLIGLIALSVASLLTGSASAASSLSGSATISGQSSSVGTETTYTIMITNTGTVNIGSMNVTVPAGYTNLRNFVVTQPTGQGWTASLQTTKTSYYVLVYGSLQGLSPGQGITFTFEAKNPSPEGTYKWVIGVNGNATTTGTSIAQSVTSTKTSSIAITSLTAALLIFAIALGIAVLNTALNRFLINYFVGWEQYRVMQKEMNEYRQETMKAARANDKKAMEKLKRRQSQINNMQSKMLKPQMVQLGVSFLYIFIWIFVLTPTYGITSMVYLPGLGGVSVVYWYPICSFFLGILSSRLLGIMPIET